MAVRRVRLMVTMMVGISLVFVILSEALLRLGGFGPLSQRVRANEPTMHEPDPVLGWKNKKGSFVVPPYVPKGIDIEMTFLEHGRRATRLALGRKILVKPTIVVIGGSFIQGWAISDHETYPWKLQERFSDLEWLNYGTAAYGTYQSLLVLERELPGLNSPSYVLYGFIPHHEVRNVGTANWMKNLSSQSQRGHISVPYVSLDSSGDLVRHPPEQYLDLPFGNISALASVLGRIKMELAGSWQRNLMRRRITERVLLKMHSISRAHGAKFAMVLLWAELPVTDHYKAFFKKHRIKLIDCVVPIVGPNLKVPGEGHPNGELNSLWAECIGDALKEEI